MNELRLRKSKSIQLKNNNTGCTRRDTVWASVSLCVDITEEAYNVNKTLRYYLRVWFWPSKTDRHAGRQRSILQAVMCCRCEGPKKTREEHSTTVRENIQILKVAAWSPLPWPTVLKGQSFLVFLKVLTSRQIFQGAKVVYHLFCSFSFLHYIWHLNADDLIRSLSGLPWSIFPLECVFTYF